MLTIIIIEPERDSRNLSEEITMKRMLGIEKSLTARKIPSYIAPIFINGVKNPY